MGCMNNHIWRVAVPTPLWTCFDYRAPAQAPDTPLVPGLRVRVPFGRREMIGVLIDIVDQSSVPHDKLKFIQEIIDKTPAMTPTVLKLYQWASDYYHHPLNSVIFSTLPKFLRQGKTCSPTWCLRYQITEAGAAALAQGIKRAPKQEALLTLLEEESQGLNPNQLKAFGRNVVNTLLEKHWMIETINDAIPAATIKESPLPLNQAQQDAVAAITQTSHFQTFLLSGITGSGKTEVYFQAMEPILSSGKQALVLVPEIVLTPQTIARFQKRFDTPIAVLHSGLSDGERMQAWMQANQGFARIIIGTRSAIFVPMKNPGIIILDEEHDTSFKQQSGFRYSARDLAVVRGQFENIPIVLGTATPSLESLYNVQRARYQKLSLPERAGAAKPPQVTVLDMRNKKLIAGMSALLIESIQTHLNNKGQILLFLNRRGYAPVLMCHQCGWSVHCPHCDANMTLHHASKRLHCHHCGSQQLAPRTCHKCKQTELIHVGVGTERLEQELKKQFPNHNILRVDRDSVSSKSGLKRTLQLAHDHADILIGTQMLAKGHHFPKLSLVAIIDADTGLFSMDFRATERLAQLLVQVSGRAGRVEKTGQVLIQTHHPDHPLLKTLLTQGYQGCGEALLKERQDAQLPPYTHFAIFRAQSPHTESAMKFLNHLKATLEKKQQNHVQILGPVPAPMEKKAGIYRAQLLFKSISRPQLQTFLKSIKQQITQNKNRGIQWSLDIDPQEML